MAEPLHVHRHTSRPFRPLPDRQGLRSPVNGITELRCMPPMGMHPLPTSGFGPDCCHRSRRTRSNARFRSASTAPLAVSLFLTVNTELHLHLPYTLCGNAEGRGSFPSCLCIPRSVERLLRVGVLRYSFVITSCLSCHKDWRIFAACPGLLFYGSPQLSKPTDHKGASLIVAACCLSSCHGLQDRASRFTPYRPAQPLISAH